mgnify:CR=1 FL=1
MKDETAKTYQIDLIEQALFYENYAETNLADAKFTENEADLGGVKPTAGKLAIENAILKRTEAGNSSFKLNDVKVTMSMDKL